MLKQKIGQCNIRVKFSDTVRADSVAELILGVVTNIALNLIPIAFVVPDVLAIGANRQQAAQLFDVVRRRPQVFIFRCRFSST
jgi:hypothetical protein